MLADKRYLPILKKLSIKTIITILFIYILTPNLFGQEKLFPKKIDNQWCYVNKNDSIILKTNFTFASRFHGNRAAVQCNNLRWGYIDQTGKIIIPLEYELTNDFNCELAPTKHKGKWGYIDTLGKVIIDFIYDDANSFYFGLAAVKIDKKYGYIDRKGTFIVKATYDFADDFNYFITPVKKDDHWGYIDTSGKIIVPLIYTRTSEFKEGFGVVGYIKGKCKKYPESYLMAKFKCREKYGFADTTGYVTMTKYDYAEDFKDGYSKVFKTPWWKLRWNYNIDWKKVDTQFIETDLID